MATTVTLANTIAWAQPFLSYAPVAIGAGSEPALTSANTILQTILAPPFAWRWNRSASAVATSGGTQDYSANIPNFGWLEKATVNAAGSTFELQIEPVLSESLVVARPEFIATQLDDDSGNITFRLMPVPDRAYTLTLTYQQKAPLLTSTSSLWAPVPDYFQYIYGWGFLSLMLDFMDSQRSVRARQIFVASLISASEGLSAEEKNLFVAAWLGELKAQQQAAQTADLGVRSRGF